MANAIYLPGPHPYHKTNKYTQTGRCNFEIREAENIVDDVFLGSQRKILFPLFKKKVTNMTKTLDSQMPTI